MLHYQLTEFHIRVSQNNPFHPYTHHQYNDSNIFQSEGFGSQIYEEGFGQYARDPEDLSVYWEMIISQQDFTWKCSSLINIVLGQIIIIWYSFITHFKIKKYNQHINMSFREYIKSLRTLLKTGQCTKYVLGNSGADYDSVIGSILYAFYMTTTVKVLHLPLIDCREVDLPLRFQITTVLDSVQINYNQLLYTDMVVNLYNSNNSFVLYDHNVRPHVHEGNLDEIVDHHAYDPSKIKCNHLINHCGSALTLLYYLYYPQFLSNFQNSDLHKKYQLYFDRHKPINKDDIKQGEQIIGQLLYYGILIDSYGFSPNQSQVWTEYDRYAIETLKQKIKPEFNFDDLGAAKFNRQKNIQLSFAQQRIKDYKLIKYGNFNIHYSTILLNIDVFVQRYWKEIQEELSAKDMREDEVHAFMFSFPVNQTKEDIAGGNFKKYILFNSVNMDILKRMQDILKQLKFQKLVDVEGWKKWCDPTGKMSRKIFDKELKSRL